MNTKQPFITIAASLAASLFSCSPLLNAQDTTAATPAPGASPAASPNTSGTGGAQDFMRQMMQRRNDGIKTALKVSDDEWAVIQPLLEKVEQAQFALVMSSNPAGGFGFGRRGGGPGEPGAGGPGGGPGAAAAQMFQGSPESQALSTALQSDSTSNDDLKTKMAAVRDARKKAEDNLAAARADLQKVLTLRQEAVLLNMGVLN
jgi:hypothetical protein